jgi:nucleoside-diphosphate kinase
VPRDRRVAAGLSRRGLPAGVAAGYKAAETGVRRIVTTKEDFRDMAIERTFSMIKPDATRRNLTGAITARLEEAGLRVVASRRVWMSRREAEGFYAVHKGRPFFDELCEFMSSGPTVVQVLEGENAIARNREVMGATNPANAAEGTIRKLFALSIGENSVHGSDAPETAAEEIAYWFSQTEIVG